MSTSVAAAKQTAGTQSGWIVSAFWDSVLFIGTPAVCIAALMPLRGVWPSERISLFLLTFFTFGHHLPGFIRAYGDRELFARYRLRFMLAPPFLFAAVFWFSAQNLHGLLLIVFTWDIWHVLMQHYGFMRIYDAKQGQTSRVVARMDLAVSITWYVALIALSPHYRHNLLYRAYTSGIPFLTPFVATVVVRTLLTVAIAVTAVYVGYTVRNWRPGNVRKLATLAIFIGATYYLYVWLDDFLVGFAVWSAFHCVQYYGIAWAYNANRVRRKALLSSMVRFLFRPSPLLVLCYLALIAAYGAINYANEIAIQGWTHQLLAAFVITSGALHYYYDGFIWKVRESQTRESLGLDRGGKPAVARGKPGWAHAAVFAAICLVLVALEQWRPQSEIDLRRSLATLSPEVPIAHANLADAHRKQGQAAEALPEYREAAARRPEDMRVRVKLGLTLASLGRDDEAVAEFEQAARRPDQWEAHYNLGLICSRRGQPAQAMTHFRQAFPDGDERSLRELEKTPDAAAVLTNLAMGMLNASDRPRAIQMLRRAAALDPRHVPSRINLGNLYMFDGKLAEARTEFDEALAIDSGYPMAHNNLGYLLMQQGRNDEARPHLELAFQNGDATVRESARKALMRLGTR